MAYYRTTLLVIAGILILCLAGSAAATSWARRQRAALQEAVETAAHARLTRERAEAVQRQAARDVLPLRAFIEAWSPYLRPAPEKELGNHVRNTLATLATRTGLTSEGATVPAEPRHYAVGSRVVRVQQVSLNVVSESLPAILTWLGAVEQQFAYARVESLTLSGYASRSAQLGVTLLVPVEEPPPRPANPAPVRS